MAISIKMRQRIYDKYGNACAYCQRAHELEIHHVIPRGPGGRHGEAKKKSDSEENLILLCKVCHDARHGIKTFYNGFSCSVCPVSWACQFNQDKKPLIAYHATAYSRSLPGIDYENIVEQPLQVFEVVKVTDECNQELKS